jgi:hypothetical protein
MSEDFICVEKIRNVIFEIDGQICSILYECEICDSHMQYVQLTGQLDGLSICKQMLESLLNEKEKNEKVQHHQNELKKMGV